MGKARKGTVAYNNLLARNKKWKEENPDSFKLSQRRCYYKTKYGLSLVELAKKEKEQNGFCAICTKSPTKRGLFVDHDHNTGKVRGLLCYHCNVVLGHFRDETDRLLSAVAYLARYK